MRTHVSSTYRFVNLIFAHRMIYSEEDGNRFKTVLLFMNGLVNKGKTDMFKQRSRNLGSRNANDLMVCFYCVDWTASSASQYVCIQI